MQNGLNTTQDARQTGNPQGAAPSEGANNSADFQQTAPLDALDANTTLVPNDAPAAQPGAAGSSTPWAGYVLFAVAAALIIFVAYKYILQLLQDQSEEELVPPAEPAVRRTRQAAASSAAKKPVKKTRSGKPVKKRKKKPAQKRR